MPRYSLSELVARANSGNIGYRGLRRLQSAGLDQGSLAHTQIGPGGPLQGMSNPQLAVDPSADLTARRGLLYANALQQAHDAGGAPLSAGIARRLELGPGGGQTFAPRSQEAVGQFGGNYNAILDALRKRKVASTAPVYRY